MSSEDLKGGAFLASGVEKAPTYWSRAAEAAAELLCKSVAAVEKR